MKKETIKEMGKYLLDISKILLALAMITPLMKGGSVSFITIVLFAVLFVSGTHLTNKGAKNE